MILAHTLPFIVTLVFLKVGPAFAHVLHFGHTAGL